jgi:hypothetical protein
VLTAVGVLLSSPIIMMASPVLSSPELACFSIFELLFSCDDEDEEAIGTIEV